MIANVVLRGYGNGTVITTIALVSTNGYSIGAATAAIIPKFEGLRANIGRLMH